MRWIRNMVRMWLGLRETDGEIETLYSEVAMLRLEMEDQMERLQKQDPMDSPNNSDPKDIPTEDTPDAHLGAF
jgi:predicted ATP-grasp superfamily ATP-dependent carboligase|tara:strand:- start:2595 stop:2813 length:219 start_codon:yes stop_codon:yes gene_type:complete